MDKERLEELIKQNGMVYFGTYNEDNVFILRKIKLSHCYILDNELHDEQECCYYDFADLFETKEQAKWHCKVDAERTERFEPPMWEEIDNEYNFNFINNLNGCLIRTPMFFCVIKDANAIFIRDDYEEELIEFFNATKENYEKACEIVRDLFKGEK